MDSGTKKSHYYGWSVLNLKNELTKRGAVINGRKEDLIERLEAYDRNQDFRGEVVILPEPLDPDWPVDGFHQLQLEHKIHLPKLAKEQIDVYFKYRMADDNEQISDLKALQKGKQMYESQKIYACSINVKTPFISTGIVGAAMRKN